MSIKTFQEIELYWNALRKTSDELCAKINSHIELRDIVVLENDIREGREFYDLCQKHITLHLSEVSMMKRTFLKLNLELTWLKAYIEYVEEMLKLYKDTDAFFNVVILKKDEILRYINKHPHCELGLLNSLFGRFTRTSKRCNAIKALHMHNVIHVTIISSSSILVDLTSVGKEYLTLLDKKGEPK